MISCSLLRIFLQYYILSITLFGANVVTRYNLGKTRETHFSESTTFGSNVSPGGGGYKTPAAECSNGRDLKMQNNSASRRAQLSQLIWCLRHEKWEGWDVIQMTPPSVICGWKDNFGVILSARNTGKSIHCMWFEESEQGTK